MTTFMPPPPASTFLAFHPMDNNIIAIGMEDSTIHIYNVRVDEVIKCGCTSYVSIYCSMLIANMQIAASLLGQNQIERTSEAHYWFSIFGYA